VLVEHVARRHPEAIRVTPSRPGEATGLDRLAAGANPGEFLRRFSRRLLPSQWVYRCACGEEGDQTFMAEHVMRMGADAVDHFTLHATGGRNDGG